MLIGNSLSVLQLAALCSTTQRSLALPDRVRKEWKQAFELQISQAESQTNLRPPTQFILTIFVFTGFALGNLRNGIFLFSNPKGGEGAD